MKRVISLSFAIVLSLTYGCQSTEENSAAQKAHGSLAQPVPAVETASSEKGVADSGCPYAKKMAAEGAECPYMKKMKAAGGECPYAQMKAEGKEVPCPAMKDGKGKCPCGKSLQGEGKKCPYAEQMRAAQGGCPCAKMKAKGKECPYAGKGEENQKVE